MQRITFHTIKGDAYIHIPRTSTVASPLTTCLDLLDSDRPKTRRLKTPFNMSVPVSHLIQFCSSAIELPALVRLSFTGSLPFARRGLSFTKWFVTEYIHRHQKVHDFGNRLQNYKKYLNYACNFRIKVFSQGL